MKALKVVLGLLFGLIILGMFMEFSRYETHPDTDIPEEAADIQTEP